MKKLIGIALLTCGWLAAQAPEIPFDGNINLLQLPATIHLGEVGGVATDSKGNILVYTRSGTEDGVIGGSRFFTHGGSRLLAFDSKGKFLREIGVGMYGFLFAQSVRVDAQDNIWVVDRGSSNLIKFGLDGKFMQVLSRKPESVNPPGAGRGGAGGEGGGGRGRGGVPGQGIAGDNFNKPTDVAFDAQGNMYISDAYTNARVVKLDKTGKYMSTWGSKGSGQGQFNMPNSIAVDAKGDVYVADLGNKRIQVFDGNGTYKREISGMGAPYTICISPGAHQYLYSSNSNSPDTLDDGEIYKAELDGKVLGKFGRAGKLVKEFGTVNSMDCRNPDSLLLAEAQNWRVQRVTLHPPK
jgi:hypothetical protein